jgi:hypothetical protein
MQQGQPRAGRVHRNEVSTIPTNPEVPRSLPCEAAQVERRLVLDRAFLHTRFVKAGLSVTRTPPGLATIAAAPTADKAGDDS